MAKKRKTNKKRSSRTAPQHNLPDGFWQQVGAVVMVALSVLLVVGWFGAGGPVLDWFDGALMSALGYAAYLLPILFIYLAVQIFRAEENRLPLAVKLASAVLLVWTAGLAGLADNQAGGVGGGFVGRTINGGLTALVASGVLAFIYTLLIIVTVLFVLRISPSALITWIKSLFGGTNEENEAVERIMRQAASVDAEVKMNAGVPTMNEPRAKSALNLTRSSKPKDLSNERRDNEGVALVSVNDPNWRPPSLDLLEERQAPANPGNVQQNAKIIRDTLAEFGIEVSMEDANVGPKVTQYTLRPPSGVKLTRITALETNIALNLAAQSLRIEAPIPGKSAVGIEVPNVRAADVRLRGVLSSSEWKMAREPLSFAVGADISGRPVVGALNTMPHLLIAGQTNSGKSVMINSLLCSLLFRNSPSMMKVIMVDPKRVELARYHDVPHLLTPVITEPEKTVSALKWAVNEMERRYRLLAEENYLDIASYNAHIKSARKKIVVKDADGNDQRVEDGAMPYIVIVVDEMSDLMMAAQRDVEGLIVRLAQKARAVGIHLVLATQSPRADVITGLIKANVPAKIAFTVGSQLESRIILDQGGAEKLLGKGDMLYKTATMSKPIRVQGALVTNDEVLKVADYLRLQAAPQYNAEVISQPVQLSGRGGAVADYETDEDDLYRDALKVVIESGKASTSLLQRRLRVGYGRAARIMEELEERGVIGPQDGSRPREVLVSEEALEAE